MRVHFVSALAVAASISVLAGCGDSDPAQPAGSLENPLRAQMEETQTTGGRSNEAAAPDAAGRPGYQKLVEQQSSRPDSRFSPCNLVTPAQARSIVGGPVHAPLEAPQGPTCIYRSRAGDSFVTLAMQNADFDRLMREMQDRRRIDIGERIAYCGTHGQPVLYLRVSGDRVLTIAGPCTVARRFAARAVERL
jgi:hypothetical protein